MDEIKRGRVPWAAKKPLTKPAVGQVAGQAPAKVKSAGRKKLPHLDPANVAFRGNALTGTTIDSRKDLPPFGFNPSPKRAMARRAAKLARTYPRSEKPPVHPSSTQEIARLRDPKTRRAAMLQRALNTRPAIRDRFEKMTVTKIVPDRRADGTITAYDPNSTVKASVGALTNAPQHDFYAVLAAMDEAVLRQANEVARAQQQHSGNGSSEFYPTSAYYGTGLGLTSGDTSSQEMNGNWGGSDEEDGDGFNAGPPSSFGAQPLTTGAGPQVPYSTSGDGQSGSVDIKVQQVALLQQRVNQMYSLIGNMFSRYNQAATSTLQNLK